MRETLSNFHQYLSIYITNLPNILTHDTTRVSNVTWVICLVFCNILVLNWCRIVLDVAQFDSLVMYFIDLSITHNWNDTEKRHHRLRLNVSNDPANIKSHFFNTDSATFLVSACWHQHHYSSRIACVLTLISHRSIRPSYCCSTNRHQLILWRH